MGALEDVTALAKADDVYQDFLPGFLGTCMSDDKLYGLPFQCSTPVLYYNKNAFAKAGIKAAPTTWPELEAAAKALTLRQGSTVEQWGLTIGGGWHDWIFESFVRQNELVFWRKDKVMFDAPESPQRARVLAASGGRRPDAHRIDLARLGQRLHGRPHRDALTTRPGRCRTC